MGRSFLLLRTLTPGGVEGKRFDRAFALKSAFIAPLVIFTLAAAIAAQPQLVPHPPFTQMPFVSLPMAVYLWENEMLEVLPCIANPKYPPVKAIQFHTSITSKFYGDDYAVTEA